MTSIKYDKVFSRFFSKAKTYDLAMLSEEDIGDYLTEWLHTEFAKPYIRQLFKTIKYNDLTRDINFELKRKDEDDNEEVDTDFVIEILAIGMLMSYCQSHMYNPVNLDQVFSDADQKFYSQATHLSSLQDVHNELHILQRRYISDRGYISNSYLDG